MTPVVYVVGLVLVAVGAFCILTGAPLVRLEQGWTEVIAGSVIGSAGFVIVAIGACLSRLNVLIRTFEGLSIADAQPLDAPAERALPEPAPSRAETPPEDRPIEAAPARRDEVLPEVEPAAVDPEPVRPEPDVRPEPAVPVEMGAPAVRDIEVAAPERVIRTARTRTSFLPSFIGRHVPALNRQPGSAASTTPIPAIEPVLTPLRDVAPHPGPDRTSIDLSSGWPDMAPELAPGTLADEPSGPEVRLDDGHRREREEAAPSGHREQADVSPDADLFGDEDSHGGGNAEHAGSPEPAAADHGAPKAPAADPLKPTVVGRYNAGSASYVMYSNGMIEVETETGTHQFESMQELKRFIEQQDSARV